MCIYKKLRLKEVIYEAEGNTITQPIHNNTVLAVQFASAMVVVIIDFVVVLNAVTLPLKLRALGKPKRPHGPPEPALEIAKIITASQM